MKKNALILMALLICPVVLMAQRVTDYLKTGETLQFNNKAVKVATEKARSNGKPLSVEQKNAIRKGNAITRKNANKINNAIERENTVRNKFFDWGYGTYKYYDEK